MIKKLLSTFIGVISLCVFGIALKMGFSFSSHKKHDFTGKCQLCHVSIPGEGTSFEYVQLTDTPENLCLQCHDMGVMMSHPSGVVPSGPIPLQRYLDKNQRLTCLTCHDVHKGEKQGYADEELSGLLRGHATGREFCATCHQTDILGSSGWSHNLVVTYAHGTGKMVSSPEGNPLDRLSVECLSCHDGIISKMGAVDIRTGTFEHGIGLSHPVGVDYPPREYTKSRYAPTLALPQEVRLFNGRIGCLTCHDPYGGRKNLLSMDNRRSVLCLTCHEK